MLGERMAQDCGTLSGGQMQMLAIARAMLAHPAIMLLDEPSLGLAPQAVAIAYEGLAQLSHRGLPMVVVEQKAVPIWREPDTTIMLQNGRVLRRLKDARPSDEEIARLYWAPRNDLAFSAPQRYFCLLARCRGWRADVFVWQQSGDIQHDDRRLGFDFNDRLEHPDRPSRTS